MCVYVYVYKVGFIHSPTFSLYNWFIYIFIDSFTQHWLRFNFVLVRFLFKSMLKLTSIQFEDVKVEVEDVMTGMRNGSTDGSGEEERDKGGWTGGDVGGDERERREGGCWRWSGSKLQPPPHIPTIGLILNLIFLIFLILTLISVIWVRCLYRFQF